MKCTFLNLIVMGFAVGFAKICYSLIYIEVHFVLMSYWIMSSSCYRVGTSCHRIVPDVSVDFVKKTRVSDRLWQVKYVFSDKTGTLTQNVMEYSQCSVGGVHYGADAGVETPAILQELHNRARAVSFRFFFTFCVCASRLDFVLTN